VEGAYKPSWRATVKIKVKPLKTGWIVTKIENGEEEEHGITDFGLIVRMLLEWLPRKDEFEIEVKVDLPRDTGE